MSTPITVNGNVLSLSDVAPSQDARFTNYLYIKGRTTINTEQKRELASIGVSIFEYLGQNTYLCHYEPLDLQPIRALNFVEQANVYPRRLKTSPFLEDAIRGNEQDGSSDPSTYKVEVVLHKGEDATEQFVDNLIEKTGLNRDELSVNHNKIRLTATADAITKIEELDAVKAIEEFIEKTLCNNVARQDLEIADGNVSVVGTKYEGDGQVIAVADTGFDLGSPTDTHPAFKDRVLALVSEGRKSTSGKTNDFHGHGTHVAGSVLGDGQSDTMGGKIQGAAPKAKLVLQSLLSSDTVPQLWTPTNLWDLFDMPYKSHQARVASNSWGLDWLKAGSRQVQYTSEAGAADSFVWHNQDREFKLRVTSIMTESTDRLYRCNLVFSR